MIKLIEAVCKNDGSVIIVIPDTAKCNVHDYIDNEGEDLGEKYLGKAIHIHPKPNSASEIMSKALYEKYKKSTKENDVNLIGAAASLSGL
ncbi:15436_t:CDS:2 [Rhizophagus irregularis]|nr:15436_t:CDS:2 [Rhizophagus irregularis]